MENNTVKRDNRKALPKFFLILLGAAVFGGVAGFAAGWMGHDNLSGVVTAAVTGWLTAMAPWVMAVTSAVSLAVIFWLYRSAKKLCAGWNGEDELPMEQAEEKLSWAMMAATVQVVLDMFFFAAAAVSENMSALIGVAVFVLSIALLTVAQQKLVDQLRRMNPEKQGSVYDVHFNKKWLASCDEAEQKQIGQAAYKAYHTVNVACPFLWMTLVLLSYAFDFGLLMPAFTVCLLWLLLNVTYSLEAIRLSRRKAQ